ncbi:hypothetical protein Tco_1067170 [Tanacetum coccineum]|uniref:Uncharacterized protein n=1 Tax=Tanacetum coccineum TaxID=301880 RepID=A0ABQ5HCE1_9ASTR
MALHWSGVGAATLMSLRQDETSESLLYAGWMAGPYRVEDATRGRKDDHVTSGIRAKSDRGGPKQNRSSCSPKKFLKVLDAQRWVGFCLEGVQECEGCWFIPVGLVGVPNSKGAVRTTSRGLDMALHWSGVGTAPLMSPRQDETSEPLLYAGWMAGPYRVEDATRGRNDDHVTFCNV